MGYSIIVRRDLVTAIRGGSGGTSTRTAIRVASHVTHHASCITCHALSRRHIMKRYLDPSLQVDHFESYSMDGHSDDLPYVPREISQWISAEYHGRYSRAIVIT